MQMNNKSIDRSKLNQSRLSKTNINEEPDSIIAAWNEIETIKKENQLLKEEIKAETRLVKSNKTQEVSRIQKDNSSLVEIERIQETSSNVAQLLEIESKKNKDLSILIALKREEINNNNVSLNQADGDALPQLLNRQKQSEYQLEKIRSRQNESLAQINMYKEQLNSIRRERVIFSNVFKKLEQDIKKKDDEFKKFILEKMKEEEKRQQAENQFQKTKEWAQEEIQKKEEKYQETLMQIEEDVENEKIRIIETKQPKIFETEVVEQKSIADSSIVHKNEQQNPILKKNQMIKKSTTSNIESSIEEVESLKFLFQKFKRETGIQSVDEFVDKYNRINQENEQLYNLCNQKSDRIVELQKKMQDIDSQTKKLTETDDDQTKSEGQEKKIIQQQDQKEKLRAKIKKANRIYRKMNKDITNMNTKVEHLAKVTQTPLPEEGLSDKNATKFISIIEQKISDIINMSEFCNEEVKDIERKIKEKKPKDRDINECIDSLEKNKEAERIKSRRDLEEAAFEALRDYNKKKKNK